MTDQKTVLIIEDEPDTAELFAEMMRVCGYQVVKSLGGKSVFLQVPQVEPDVIILDMMMPDVSGTDILEFMQQDNELIKVPVVMVSARSLPVDIKTGLDAGAMIYLAKPVSFADLRAAVAAALQASDR